MMRTGSGSRQCRGDHHSNPGTPRTPRRAGAPRPSRPHAAQRCTRHHADTHRAHRSPYLILIITEIDIFRCVAC